MSEMPPVPEGPKRPGNWWQRKSKFKKVQWSLAAVFVALIIIAIAFPTEDEGDDVATPTTESAATTEPESAEPEASEPETSEPEATDDNEPHVGRNGTVIVDTLSWRVLSVQYHQRYRPA